MAMCSDKVDTEKSLKMEIHGPNVVAKYST